MPPELVHIDSVGDARIKIFRDVRDRDLRGRDLLFMAESELVLRRLLRAPERLHALLISPRKYDQLADLLAPFRGPVYLAELDLMTQIAGFPIHRGVLAAGRRPTDTELTLDHALAPFRGEDPLKIVVAEGLTNVDNIGALFRNAAAFGFDGVVLDPTCCDPLYRKAIRVSMGHVLSMPWAVCRQWPEDLHRLRDEWGVTLIAAESAPLAVPIAQMPRTERIALVVGAEGDGLSEPALAACAAICNIPMASGVPSLNVSVAAAIFMYELTQGRPKNMD